MVQKALLIGNDAETVAEALRAAGTPAESITIIPLDQATSQGVKDALDALRTGTGPGDRILMHYTGPGGAIEFEGRGGPEPAQNETYPADWSKVILMVSPTGEMHAIGGERELGEGDVPFIGLERIKAKIEQEKAKVRGGVAGLRVQTMDEMSRLLIDTLDKLDLASALEIVIRTVPGQELQSELLRGRFLPVIDALVLDLTKARTASRSFRTLLDEIRKALSVGEDVLDGDLPKVIGEAALCETCHSQPKTTCNACFDARDAQHRTTIERLRAIIEKNRLECVQHLEAAMTIQADKNALVTENIRLRRLLQAARDDIYKREAEGLEDEGLLDQWAPPQIIRDLDMALAPVEPPDPMEEAYHQQLSDQQECELQAVRDEEVEALKARVAELEAERTKLLSGVVDAVADKGIEVGTELRVLKDRVAELERAEDVKAYLWNRADTLARALQNACEALHGHETAGIDPDILLDPRGLWKPSAVLEEARKALNIAPGPAFALPGATDMLYVVREWMEGLPEDKQPKRALTALRLFMDNVPRPMDSVKALVEGLRVASPEEKTDAPAR